MVDITEKKYRVPEVATMFSRSNKSIWNDIADGKIAVYRIGRSVRIGASEVRRILEEGFQPARQRPA